MLNEKYLEILKEKYGLEITIKEGVTCGDYVILKTIDNVRNKSRFSTVNNCDTVACILTNDRNKVYVLDDVQAVNVGGNTDLLGTLPLGLGFNMGNFTNQFNKISLELIYLLNNLCEAYNSEALKKIDDLENSTKLFDVFVKTVTKFSFIDGSRTINNVINSRFEFIINNSYYETVTDGENYYELLQYLKDSNYQDNWTVNGGFSGDSGNYGQILVLLGTILKDNIGSDYFTNFHMLSTPKIKCHRTDEMFTMPILDIGVGAVVIYHNKLTARTHLDGLVECTHCGELTHSLREHNGEHYCEGCFDSAFFTCRTCGAVESYSNVEAMANILDEMGSYDNRYRCVNCLEGKLEVVCPYNDYAITSCVSCPKRKSCDPFVNSWNYRPELTFYGDTDKVDELTFGIEIEIDKVDNNMRNFIKIRDKIECIYAKNDGSINDGFELVSHPMTYDYIKTVDWEGVFKRASALGYRSHDTNTCGYHIHIGRDRLQGQRHIARIIKVVYNLWDEFARFSRRNINRLDEWSKKPEMTNRDDNDTIIAKNDGDRYVAVNLRNRATIEFRMFRGTLNANTFIATIQLIKSLIELTKGRGNLDFTFEDIVNYKKYDELNKYMLELVERDDRRGAQKAPQNVSRISVVDPLNFDNAYIHEVRADWAAAVEETTANIYLQPNTLGAWVVPQLCEGSDACEEELINEESAASDELPIDGCDCDTREEARRQHAPIPNVRTSTVGGRPCYMASDGYWRYSDTDEIC